jgi:hypothetical protein
MIGSGARRPTDSAGRVKITDNPTIRLRSEKVSNTRELFRKIFSQQELPFAVIIVWLQPFYVSYSPLWHPP